MKNKAYFKNIFVRKKFEKIKKNLHPPSIKIYQKNSIKHDCFLFKK
jgi:hypothetical protein